MRNRYFKWLGVKNIGLQRIIMVFHTFSYFWLIILIAFTVADMHYALAAQYGISDASAAFAVTVVLFVLVAFVTAAIALPIKAISWIIDGFKKGSN